MKRTLIPEYPCIQNGETVIYACSEYIWLGVIIKTDNKEILSLSISKERDMFVADRFLSNIVDECGKHLVL